MRPTKSILRRFAIRITLLSDELSTRIDQLMLGFHQSDRRFGRQCPRINRQTKRHAGRKPQKPHRGHERRGEKHESVCAADQYGYRILEQCSAVSDREFDSGIRRQLSEVLANLIMKFPMWSNVLPRSSAELGDAAEALPRRHHALCLCEGAP